jgi:ABC-type multidrug transport system ATPase subunit
MTRLATQPDQTEPEQKISPALESFAHSLRTLATSRGVAPDPRGSIAPRVGPSIVVDRVTRSARGETILEPVSFAARSGEIVAIAGSSGAGKTTLLNIMAGLVTPSGGDVYVNGTPVDPAGLSARVGYVPQDDIVHADLSLRRTLSYAAELRMAGLGPDARRSLVDRTLTRLGLLGCAETPVGSLSGGQRKRASIGVELLAEPDVFVLDEPTSGLDPVSADEVMRQLRRLASDGATIIITTHAPADIGHCDRVVFLATGGRQAFTGSITEALAWFGVDDIEAIYACLETAPRHETAPIALGPAPAPNAAPAPSTSVGWVRQWWATTRRTAEMLVRNRLTMAILIGSPVMVIAMMAALFQPGAFDRSSPDPSSAVQVVFWAVFNACFFGLTYGLLQIVTERPIVDREQAAGLRPGAYVAAKTTVLLPFLAFVDGAMLWVLTSAGQLPPLGLGEGIALWGTLVLVSAAALGVGLLASAGVRNAAQATLALPMLCFPQVLFAGAIVPVADMTPVGRALSTVLAGRWGFDSFSRTLGMSDRLGAEAWSNGLRETFSGSPTMGAFALAVMTVATAAVTARVLRPRGIPARS